jgi:hypothetical protein
MDSPQLTTGCTNCTNPKPFSGFYPLDPLNLLTEKVFELIAVLGVPACLPAGRQV